MQTEDILGYPVATVCRGACVDALMQRIDAAAAGKAGDGSAGDGTAAGPFWLACLNPHSVLTAKSDPAAAAALKAADILIPDGAGVVLASKILGGRIRERVTGSDVFRGVLEELNRTGRFSVFLLGSTEENLAAIRMRMALDFPAVRVAGTYSPPFKPVFSDADNERMVAAINAAEPDVLWVGMTAPKQEKWIVKNRDRLNVKFAAAVGAVFDFYTEKVKRSPPAFQKMGLEWLPRLMREPRRLWRRNLVSTPAFLFLILKAFMKKG